MDDRKICSISSISKYLCDEYNAVEISINEFAYQSGCVSSYVPTNTIKVYKIEDEKVIQNLLSENEKEEILITIEHLERNNISEYGNDNFCSLYINEISTGKLIIITLESDDNINLSGFTMQGNGEMLYNYLLNLIDEDIEQNHNELEETISELNQFRPYGKYFK